MPDLRATSANRVVGWHWPDARINHEKYGVCLVDCRLGLGAHPTRKAFGRRLLEARSINDCKLNIAKPALTFTPIARDAGPIINQGQTPADQPIEQS